VGLADGRKGITLRSPCDLLQIERSSQRLRIERSPKFAALLVLVPIEFPSGLLVLDVLLSPAIPLWLLGLQTGRLAPEKQALAILLKDRAIDTIEAAFSADSSGFAAGSAKKLRLLSSQR